MSSAAIILCKNTGCFPIYNNTSTNGFLFSALGGCSPNKFYQCFTFYFYSFAFNRAFVSLMGSSSKVKKLCRKAV